MATAASFTNITAAIDYAAEWWNGYNTAAYPKYSDDCMNFVSQILVAGGTTTGSVWYPGSDSWINADDFYLSERQWYDPTGYHEAYYANSNMSEISSGDAIGWDWGGLTLTGNFDIQHESWVLASDGVNQFYVTSHTNPRWNYPSTSEFAYQADTLFIDERPNGL